MKSWLGEERLSLGFVDMLYLKQEIMVHNMKVL